jgi:hypothetical protein
MQADDLEISRLWTTYASLETVPKIFVDIFLDKKSFMAGLLLNDSQPLAGSTRLIPACPHGDQNHAAGPYAFVADAVDPADVVYESADVPAFALVFGGDAPQRVPRLNFDLGVFLRFRRADGLFGKRESCQK